MPMLKVTAQVADRLLSKLRPVIDVAISRRSFSIEDRPDPTQVVQGLCILFKDAIDCQCSVCVTASHDVCAKSLRIFS